jgi:hypothetical protein
MMVKMYFKFEDDIFSSFKVMGKLLKILTQNLSEKGAYF